MATEVKQAATEPLPDFATAQEVQDYTKGKLKAGEPRVPAALSAISASIRNEAGWHIWPILENHTMALNGEGGTLQDLPTGRLVALHSVVNAGTPVDVESIDISLDGQMQRMDGGLWTRRLGKLLVTMDHGYGDVPDLKALCLALVARGLASPFGATQESAGTMSVSWGNGVSGGVLQAYSGEASTLNKYRWVTP